ncbi:DUF4040 domain-containing protein [Actinacidiphila sp. DG2A-62]|uniref:Na(+)/H(+) antiporter subunit B n=1 Tax=Actinacidiphila sp. DG2A-62 TaxID=3108821 RepID=UPI002DBBC2CC|nr:DUF4040 domain-containing protein [Actinacidiphila sp. DG2A-62]MEC3993887.1 DUF4040 domain-containing protein [Actinacidiphila sp. DG2A-62]
MNTPLVAVALAFVVVCATVAVLCRDPVRQALVLAVLGLGLAVLFAVLQAPDVALSQLGVGTALTPLLILLTVRKVSRRSTADADAASGGDGADGSGGSGGSNGSGSSGGSRGSGEAGGGGSRGGADDAARTRDDAGSDGYPGGGS